MRRVRKLRRRVDILLPKDDSANNPSRIVKGVQRNKVVKKVTVPTQVAKAEIKRKEPYITPKTFKPIEPIWQGETVYLIGGGPSLKGFEWNRLKGKKTIAINKAIEFWPQADAMYWTDGRIYSWLKEKIHNFKGLKFTVRAMPYEDKTIHILRKGQKFGLETARDTLAHGNNSGYAAINLAIHLGAKRIVLLGYDMGNNGKNSHFHDGYPVNATGENIYKDQFLPGFNVIKELLKGKDIQIFNACPTSKLNAFKKITIDEALALR